ncbi:MAG TPA: hypothetical protein VFI73_07765 [Candidatus Nitrosopolaris sp.]|nr:hypothetical protein [Candidatus Nitrosopolaris sp.]
MGRTKADSNKPSEEKLPEWAEREIRSVQFGEEQVIRRSGYILDTYENDFKVDIQLYEPLPDKRAIIEGLDIPKSMRIGDFKKGFVYEFKIKMFKGDLSARLVEFLKTRFSLDMDAIYRFELEDLQLMEIESDAYSSPAMSPEGTGNDIDDV